MLRKYALHTLIAPIEIYRTVGDFFLTLPYALASYLRILVVPVGLTGLYYNPFPTSHLWFTLSLSVVAVAAYAGLVWFWRKRTGDRMVVFLALWPLISLVPVLYLAYFTDGVFLRDRYAYLPSVGFILLSAKAIRLLPNPSKIKAGALQAAVSAVILLAYIAGCSQQIYWANELSQFRRGHELFPNNDFTTVGLARLLQRNGDTDGAIRLLKQVTEQHLVDQNAYNANLQLAEAYSRLGNVEDGREALSRALILRDQLSVGRGDAEVADIAGLLGRLGDYDRALQLCALVLQGTPDLVSALYNCGNINFQAGRYAQAEQLLSRAVQVAPGDPNPIYWLGRVYLQTGRLPQAQMAFRQALQARPDSYDYHYRLAESLEGAGDLANARLQYQEALRWNPDGQEAKLRLAALDHAH
jgi:tetratricopeptide (TPR) repeat protein